MQVEKVHVTVLQKLQVHESTTLIWIIMFSSWGRPSVYGYDFNFSLSSHNLSKF
jgi:hypothetical protein